MYQSLPEFEPATPRTNALTSRRPQRSAGWGYTFPEANEREGVISRVIAVERRWRWMDISGNIHKTEAAEKREERHLPLNLAPPTVECKHPRADRITATRIAPARSTGAARRAWQTITLRTNHNDTQLTFHYVLFGSSARLAVDFISVTLKTFRLIVSYLSPENVSRILKLF